MATNDLEILKLKYPGNCKTNSTNPAILELYAFLLKNETVDSDVWTVGGGNDQIIRLLESCFLETDWQELELDLENWTTNQLEIFTESIVEGNGQYENDPVSSTVMQRFKLLKKLLIIAKQRDIYRNDILLSLINNISFLNKCDAIAPDEAMEIADYFDYSERIKTEISNDNITLLTLKAMIEKANH